MTTRRTEIPARSGEVLGLDRRELLTRHVDGDSSAFTELMNLYRKPVFSYLCRCGVAQSNRDDLFQEIFLNIHRSSARYQPESPLVPWIFTIVANATRSHFRKQKVRAAVQGEESSEGRSESTAHQLLEGTELASWLERELIKLPLEQREVFLLCAVQGLEQQHAAECLKLNPNTVKTNLRRARAALATALTRRSIKLQREVLG